MRDWRLDEECVDYKMDTQFSVRKDVVRQVVAEKRRPEKSKCNAQD